MKTLEELIAEYKSLIAQARAKADEWKGKEGGITKEASDAIDALLGKADEVKVQIEAAKQRQATLDRVDAGEGYLSDSNGPTAAPLGWRKSGPGEGDAPVDPQAWRELEIKTFELDSIYGVIVPVTRKIRFHVPEVVVRKGYPSAFEAYLRKGYQEMGPNDKKTLSEGTDSAGGFTIPEDYHVELIRKIATNTTVRQNARVVQTSRDIASWPKIHYTTDDKYTSGVRFTWTGETPSSSTVHRVTDPVFGLYSIPVHTAMASMPITNSLLEDSAFDIVGVSSDLLAEAFALGENNVFWNGTGIAQPMGILAQVDGDGPASVVSGTAATLLAGGIIDIAYALPAQYERNAKWYMAKATEKVIRKFADTQGNYLWPIWPNQGNLSPAPRELLGYPTVRDEFLPAVAAGNYPIVFGDLMGYLILDRVGISVQRLTELYAETDITLLLARKRVGGQVIQPWRMKVQKVSA
jgi:HK97 family phage major capsid protein